MTAEPVEELTPETKQEEVEPVEEREDIQETPQIEAEPAAQEQESIPKSEEKHVEPELQQVEVEEKKKKKPWLFLLVLIPIVAVAIFIVLKGYNNGESNNETPTNLTTTEELPTKPEPTIIDSISADSLAGNKQDTTLAADTIQPTPEVQEELPQEQDVVKYYLVGGSFSIKENADTYLAELKEKGYDAFHVGKKGRFFIIGIASYNSFSEADSAKIKYMEDNPGSEVWVYRK